MCSKIVVFFIFFNVLSVFGANRKQVSWGVVGNPLLNAHPCNGSDEITLSFEPNLPPEEENQYSLGINIDFPVSTKIEIQFDAEATVTLFDKTYARIRSNGDDNQFLIHFYKPHQGVSFKVQGVSQGVIPYIKSLIINKYEYCDHPLIGFLDSQIQGYEDQAVSHKSKIDSSCGRRKVTHTELIVNGESTKPGDWPWHVALYKLNRDTLRYICGGTLLSKSFVLTAAHCTTVRGVPILPEVLNVVLGKHNLIGGDVAAQERSVHEIIVHEEFDVKNLEHDISLLKLSTIAVFDDYIQPACLWESSVVERLPTGKILGTVVGWGFDQTDSLASQLQQAILPILPDATCIRKNPLFYGKILTETKFCAGVSNGTSPCNGDSGGGFVVFVPDTPRDESQSAGAWYVRGIVSTTVARTDAPICDPTQNVVFTDIAKHKSWIKNYIKNDLKSD
ncbi:chymotrypsin-C-like [Aricia agestis]|uniref:chymotrypsin-C-like n=1 Tax=Aricia agestis TaxID=91739 RepID=UPI001C20A837|nr:chymotrypsin-C-like [Aricia agestis]